jgi:hypothetical protein
VVGLLALAACDSGDISAEAASADSGADTSPLAAAALCSCPDAGAPGCVAAPDCAACPAVQGADLMQANGTACAMPGLHCAGDMTWCDCVGTVWQCVVCPC